MSWLDRTTRFIAAGMLILLGILVAALALPPIAVGLAGFCPSYILFGISTLGRKQN